MSFFIETTNRWFLIEANMEKRIYYLSNTVIPNTKREKNIHVFNVLTQVGVKQLTDFLRTVTSASDLVDCTLVNCDNVHLKIIVSVSEAVLADPAQERCNILM